MSKLSKYKNIVNKSRDLSKKDPYDLFVKSLPSELDYYKNGDNYRLKAAWTAYGKPKDASEALFNGMIDFFGETPKMASIGYNDETDSYEYLYSGKDNDNVNRDIRVWENDVIPFVKELKNGGYIRTFDEEQNCWKYTKGGKNEVPAKDDMERTVQAFKQGGQMNVIPEGALHAHKNHMEGAGKDFTAKGIPVMDNNGNQTAEIEREELILNKENTDKVEDLYKKFYSDDLTENEKDELAIKAGKKLAKELIENVDDRVGLIDKIDNGN